MSWHLFNTWMWSHSRVNSFPLLTRCLMHQIFHEKQSFISVEIIVDSAFNNDVGFWLTFFGEENVRFCGKCCKTMSLFVTYVNNLQFLNLIYFKVKKLCMKTVMEIKKIWKMYFNKVKKLIQDIKNKSKIPKTAQRRKWISPSQIKEYIIPSQNRGHFSSLQKINH